jgi:hypothetical protein
MSKPGLEEVFSQLLSAEQAFVFYRLPNDKTVHCHHQEDARLTYTTDLKIKGFVMSRFDTPLPAVYISDKNHLQFDYNPPNFMGKEVEPYIDLEKKTSFINIVNETKKAIASGHLKKLVVGQKNNPKTGGRCSETVYPFTKALSPSDGPIFGITQRERHG